MFKTLAVGASVLACYANETVMDCFVASWVDGSEIWSVWHDANQGARHLEASGTPPEQFQPIRDRFFAHQADATGVDYIFNIPIELFVALGGIRYNEDISDAGPWQVLTRITQIGRWWWPFK